MASYRRKAFESFPIALNLIGFAGFIRFWFFCKQRLGRCLNFNLFAMRKNLMNFLKSVRLGVVAFCLGVLMLTTSACSGATQASQSALPSASAYSQLERGDTASGEQFGQWVLRSAQGLIDDAYVRDNDKLGVVISPQVKPREVKDLARSLMQGFHKNFPNRDLSVLVYAPDKELILSANYDETTRQIEYQ